MKIIEQIIIKLEPKDIEELVRAHLEKEGYDVKDLKFKLTDKCDSDGPYSSSHKEFDGVKCDVTRKCRE